MENSDQIRNKLEIITEKYPRNVVKSLSEGDLIQQGWSNLFYEIDDPEIYCKIGQFPAGMVPYSSIFHAIDGTFIGPKYFEENGSIKDETTILPYSKVVNEGVGQCLETAIMVQLTAQKGRDAFLINGSLQEDDEGPYMWHAFNVVFKDDQPFLIDARNPWKVDKNKKVTNPCIIPIIGIESSGEFIFPEEYRCGRRYSII